MQRKLALAVCYLSAIGAGVAGLVAIDGGDPWYVAFMIAAGIFELGLVVAAGVDACA